MGTWPTRIRVLIAVSFVPSIVSLEEDETVRGRSPVIMLNDSIELGGRDEAIERSENSSSLCDLEN